MMNLGIKNITNEMGVEYFCILLSRMIESREKDAQARILLKGVLKLHMKNSTNDDQVELCRFILCDASNQEEAKVKTKRFYRFVLVVLDEGITMFPKSPRLHLLSAYLN